MLRSQNSSLFFLAVLFFWPTYVAGVGNDLGQKSHYFVCAFFALLLAVISRQRQISLIGIAIFLPYLILVGIVFPLRMPIVSLFEIGIIVKLILFIVITNCVYIFLKPITTRGKESKFIGVILLIYSLEAAFVVAQFVFGDNSILQLWSSHTVQSYWGFRAPGTFEWVYSLCFVSVFLLTYCGFGLSFGGKKYKLIEPLLFFLYLLIVALSQSKAGYISLIFTLIYGIYLDRILRGQFNLKLLGLLLTFISFILILSYFSRIELSYIVNFIETISSGELDPSSSYRKLQIELALTQGLDNWYRGVPINENMLIIENAYFDYLYRYGITGLISYCIFIFMLYFYSLRVLRKVSKDIRRGVENLVIYRLSLSVHLTFFSAFWFSLSFAPLDGYKTSVWSYFCLALCMAISQRQMPVIQNHSAS